MRLWLSGLLLFSASIAQANSRSGPVCEVMGPDLRTCEKSRPATDNTSCPPNWIEALVTSRRMCAPIDSLREPQ